MPSTEYDTITDQTNFDYYLIDIYWKLGIPGNGIGSLPTYAIRKIWLGMKWDFSVTDPPEDTSMSTRPFEIQLPLQDH